MSTELVELKQALALQEQRAEILELKYKLQKVQSEKASRLEDSLLSQNLFDHYQKVAEMLSKSGFIPSCYKGKKEDIFVAMAMGYQLGFPIEQSLQDIAVVNGRPCLWGDGLLSLALNHPDCQSIDEEPIVASDGRVIGYRCTVTRRGHAPHVKQFTLQDATSAGLISKGLVWKTYPERMLQMRARSFAIRDKFADVLRGLRISEIEEEDSRVIDAEIAVPKEGNQVDKLKSFLKNRDELNGNDSSSELVVSKIPEISEKPEISEISEKQLTQIKILLQQKSFPEERVTKALAHYHVKSFEELNYNQATSFLSQLERAQ